MSLGSCMPRTSQTPVVAARHLQDRSRLLWRAARHQPVQACSGHGRRIAVGRFQHIPFAVSASPPICSPCRIRRPSPEMGPPHLDLVCSGLRRPSPTSWTCCLHPVLRRHDLCVVRGIRWTTAQPRSPPRWATRSCAPGPDPAPVWAAGMPAQPLPKPASSASELG